MDAQICHFQYNYTISRQIKASSVDFSILFQEKYGTKPKSVYFSVISIAATPGFVKKQRSDNGREVDKSEVLPSGKRSQESVSTGRKKKRSSSVQEIYCITDAGTKIARPATKEEMNLPDVDSSDSDDEEPVNFAAPVMMMDKNGNYVPWRQLVIDGSFFEIWRKKQFIVSRQQFGFDDISYEEKLYDSSASVFISTKDYLRLLGESFDLDNSVLEKFEDNPLLYRTPLLKKFLRNAKEFFYQYDHQFFSDDYMSYWFRPHYYLRVTFQMDDIVVDREEEYKGLNSTSFLYRTRRQYHSQLEVD